MRYKKMLFFSCFLVMIFILTDLAGAQTGNPQETLNQYITDLQKKPGDYALREKIIKHVRTMEPAPEIPEEARRYMGRGIAAMKEAKSADDFRDAVKEFEKAALAAPWLANAYYNLGIAQDKAGIYADAIKSLELYLLAASDTRDAESVKGLIYEIEYRKEKAEKEISPEAIAAKEKQEWEKLLKKLNGGRWNQPDTSCNVAYFEVLNGKIRSGQDMSKCPTAGSDSYTVDWEPLTGRIFDWGAGKLNISEDGQTITWTSSRTGHVDIYYRIR